MEPVRRAVIDVGTNSIKLLVADILTPSLNDVRAVWEASKQTRLGRGFYESHRLQSEAIAATANAVEQFTRKARELQAGSIRVIATSAARDAVNSEELTSAIQRASSLRVDIISGDQEAEWAFQGVTTDPSLARVPLLLLDVGGGSTEFILGQSGHMQFRHSFALGTVRLLEQMALADPPKPEELTACRAQVREFLQTHVQPSLEPALRQIQKPSAEGPLQLVGTGGTASILGCMEACLTVFDRQQIEAARLPRERLRWHAERLWNLPLAERKQVVGLPPNRADVILTGVIIYEELLGLLGFANLRLSTRGLRFGALLSAA